MSAVDSFTFLPFFLLSIGNFRAADLTLFEWLTDVVPLSIFRLFSGGGRGLFFFYRVSLSPSLPPEFRDGPHLGERFSLSFGRMPSPV